MDSVELVKQICKERKIPISKLERECNFANGYIRKLKEGKFPSDRLKVIADYLDVPVEYLMTGEMPEEPEEHYYMDDDAREYAELLFHHPEYKVLFDAARNVPAKDIDIVRQLIERFSDYDA